MDLDRGREDHVDGLTRLLGDQDVRPGREAALIEVLGETGELGAGQALEERNPCEGISLGHLVAASHVYRRNTAGARSPIYHTLTVLPVLNANYTSIASPADNGSVEPI